MNKNKSGRTHRMPSIRKNYTYNLIYQVMTLLTPFITTPYLSRVFRAGRNGDPELYQFRGSVFCHCGGSWNSLLRAEGDCHAPG